MDVTSQRSHTSIISGLYIRLQQKIIMHAIHSSFIIQNVRDMIGWNLLPFQHALWATLLFTYLI